jgi:hypothetical protein
MVLVAERTTQHS